jgi:hypothetical protein
VKSPIALAIAIPAPPELLLCNPSFSFDVTLSKIFSSSCLHFDALFPIGRDSRSLGVSKV